MLTQKAVEAAFEAAGDRMDGFDRTVEEMKEFVEQALKQIRRLGKGLISGMVEGRDYPGFWPNESMARDFAAVFAQACKRDFPGIDTKDMGTGTGAGGGVLVPDELAAWIIQKLGVYGKFRKNALTVKMGTGRQWIPKVSADLTIYAPGEGTTITKSDMKFAMVKLEAIKLACLTAINTELNEDSSRRCRGCRYVCDSLNRQKRGLDRVPGRRQFDVFRHDRDRGGAVRRR